MARISEAAVEVADRTAAVNALLGSGAVCVLLLLPPLLLLLLGLPSGLLLVWRVVGWAAGRDAEGEETGTGEGGGVDCGGGVGGWGALPSRA